MENIYLRDLSDRDKEAYVSLQRELWVDPRPLDREDSVKFMWENTLKEEQLNYVICQGDSVLGFCGVAQTKDAHPEIEIELFERYQHKGLAEKAIGPLMERAMEAYGDPVFKFRVMPDNYPSILLMRKIGARPSGLEMSKGLVGEDLVSYEKRNERILDDNLKRVADLFHTEPRTLLTHVLVFFLDSRAERKEAFEVHFEGDLRYQNRLNRYIYECLLLFEMRNLNKILQLPEMAAGKGQLHDLRDELEQRRQEVEQDLKCLWEGVSRA